MKTIKLKNGNRNLQVEKVVLRSGAILISVVLLSFTVSAQGLWKQLLTYNSFGKMAMLMVSESEDGATGLSDQAGTKALPAAKMSSFYDTPASDGSLDLESWMTDDSYFGAYNHLFDVVVDNPLGLEGWMLNDAYFCSRIRPEADKKLELETWMNDDNYWVRH